ncbi:MAG: ASCH domain-containing protein [Thermoprotei archaeon]|nr:MAG: ASCH domain-containing protein [Thermoprotei archaeon]RLF16067.1 MAG: ASCH domain-containing protein [Thermoprotei archaeon]
MKGEFVELVLRGAKRTTIRLGLIKPRHKVVVLHGGGRDVAKLEITGVEHKRLRELTEEDAKRDGFNSLEELLKALRKVYGKFGLDEPVTIINFKVLKLLDDKPSSMLSPAKVAEAMLESGLTLTNEERRILSEVAKKGSIRKAAVSLYGDVNRRWLVRRVLRKALRNLAEREFPREGERWFE